MPGQSATEKRGQRKELTQLAEEEKPQGIEREEKEAEREDAGKVEDRKQ